MKFSILFTLAAVPFTMVSGQCNPVGNGQLSACMGMCDFHCYSRFKNHLLISGAQTGAMHNILFLVKPREMLIPTQLLRAPGRIVQVVGTEWKSVGVGVDMKSFVEGIRGSWVGFGAVGMIRRGSSLEFGRTLALALVAHLYFFICNTSAGWSKALKEMVPIITSTSYLNMLLVITPRSIISASLPWPPNSCTFRVVKRNLSGHGNHPFDHNVDERS